MRLGQQRERGTLFFLQGQFYKDNEAQIWLKIKDNLRTSRGSFARTLEIMNLNFVFYYKDHLN